LYFILNFKLSLITGTLNDEQLLEFAKIGSFNEFDLFGNEVSYYELSDVFDMPSGIQSHRVLI
jgi:hypothetical protein